MLEPDLDRRRLLHAGLIGGAAVVLGAGTWLVGGRRAAAETPPWGRLEPARDRATGLPLLKLPPGFSYVSYGWTGDPLAGGVPTPPQHDGMGVVRVGDGRAVLVRNHEVRGEGTSFATGPVYDPHGAGGTTTLVFDLAAGRWESARPSLAGTSANCSGGVTPWGTWLSCEETLLYGRALHGFVFEVPADGPAVPEPIEAMGCFSHEAVVVDPTTGIVYETEDHGRAGFYRFVPATPGRLRDGGRLEMLRVADRHGIRLARRVRPGTTFAVDWVPIDTPRRAHGAATHDGNGVLWQGRLQGAATFSRLEGAWWGDDGVYFVSTDGGDAKAGQIWHFHPRRSTLRLVLDAGGRRGIERPDGATALPVGAWLVAEDCDRRPARMAVVRPDGRTLPFAENAAVLAGERNGLEGDFRDGLFTGMTFAGGWLFANLQAPGITVAITGPWDRLHA